MHYGYSHVYCSADSLVSIPLLDFKSNQNLKTDY